MGSIATFLPGLATGSAAVNTGSDVVDSGSDLVAEILKTVGGFVTQATGSLTK